MIESDTWCPDVITRLGSVTRAPQEVATGLLADDLQHCVATAIRTSSADGDRALDEITGSIRQVIRL